MGALGAIVVWLLLAAPPEVDPPEHFTISVVDDRTGRGVPLVELAPKAAITHSIIALADTLDGDREKQASPATSTPRTGLGRLLSFWPNK